jgi:nicotinamide-nucleotide amidase
MKAEIITIGDELLIGQVVDTNSAFIATKLNEAGIHVHQITSVSDNREHIIEALGNAAEKADIILMTGGLGPTNDDITKLTLCEYFKVGLKFNPEAYKDVEYVFKVRGREVSEINRKQAELPENSIALSNKNGTAPGMWFDVNARPDDPVGRRKIYISMPGVPYEMKALMEDEVIPRLKKQFTLPVIVHRNVLTIGIGESVIAEKIAAWEASLANDKIKLAYLPSIGMVRLRLSTSGADRTILEKNVENKITELQGLVGDYIYGYEKDTLEEIVGSLLKERKQTLSLAESCTGGYISHLITAISGSSDYYKGSVVAYAYEIKTIELGVSEELLNTKGAVSQEVVEQMASSVRKKFNTDYSIAVSGIAGPGGGTPDKPVGLVWIALATPEKVFSKKCQFATNRLRNIQMTANTALNLLRKEILAGKS